MGLEIFEDRLDIGILLVLLLGGGFVVGVVLVVKVIKFDIKVIGLMMDCGVVMYVLFQVGCLVEVEEVLSFVDFLGGGIGFENWLFFVMCWDLLDDVLFVSEDEIYKVMQVVYFEDGYVVEGVCVVGIVVLFVGKLLEFVGLVVMILIGCNVDWEQFVKVIMGQDVVFGNLMVEGRFYYVV